MRARSCRAAGYSLLEVLVALALMGIAMGSTYGSVIAQMRRQAAQAMQSEALHAGRAAMKVVTAQISNAGFGVPTVSIPSAAATIITAQPTVFSFWSNVSVAHTYLTAAAATGNRTLAVLSGSGIALGTGIYVADASRWFRGSVKAVRTNAIDLNQDLTYNFAAGTPVIPIEQVTFDFAGEALRRNGRVFIPNVTNLSFTYDAVAPEQIRRITISLTLRARGPDLGGVRRTITLGAVVAPPNLAL